MMYVRYTFSMVRGVHSFNDELDQWLLDSWTLGGSGMQAIDAEYK